MDNSLLQVPTFSVTQTLTRRVVHFDPTTSGTF